MKLRTTILFAAAFLCSLQAVAQTWPWTWVKKVGPSGFNHSITVNPQNPDVLYASPGNNTIVISRDRGRTWQTFSTVSGGSQVKMIRVNARDTSVILVAQEAGPPDRIMKSTNNGATWTQVFSGNFWYWGHPLAYNPAVLTEVVYTMGSNVVYRSEDFGTSWTQVGPSNPFGSSNQGWESAIIRQDSSNILYVGDNATGIWKTTNSGTSWRRVYVATGEVPALALARTNPAVAYGTKFGGGGGFVKTTDYGETWQAIPQFNGLNTWGVDVSPENENYVIMGTWGPSFSTTGGAYLSRDGGATWERTYQGLVSTSNHQCFVLDTMTVLTLWGDGIWKLRMPGKISGICFNDSNGNGVRDPGEPALQNWRVRISGSRTDSTLTDGNGVYQFGLLAVGDYSVSVAVAQDWVVTVPFGGIYPSLSVSDGEQHENKSFGITQRSLSIVAPNGGETWPVGTTDTIRWASQFITGSVTIELSRDGGGSFESLFAATPNDGQEAWLVTGPATTQARVRVYSIDYPTATSTSSGNFTIGGSTVTVGVPIAANWNIVSNPVSTPIPGDSVRQLYTNSVFPYGFAFAGSYVQSSTMPNGPGYWIKSATAYTQSITGVPRDTLTIPVQSGWNMIGSISTSIDTSAAHVTPTPSDLRGSVYFQYNNGYVVATMIEPGGGYWVKTNSAGSFFLHTTGPSGDAMGHLQHAPMGSKAGGRSIQDLNTLTLHDDNGGSQTLYFGPDAHGEIPVSVYALPPVPPAGFFDARFETSDGGAMVQVYANEVGRVIGFPIAIQASAFPVTVTWNIRDHAGSYELSDGGASAFGTHPMRGEGRLQIANEAVRHLMLKVTGSGAVAPNTFALWQDYPNQGTEEQGRKTVHFDGSHLASGDSLNQIQAGEFSMKRKMPMVK